MRHLPAVSVQGAPFVAPSAAIVRCPKACRTVGRHRLARDGPPAAARAGCVTHRRRRPLSLTPSSPRPRGGHPLRRRRRRARLLQPLQAAPVRAAVAPPALPRSPAPAECRAPARCPAGTVAWSRSGTATVRPLSPASLRAAHCGSSGGGVRRRHAGAGPGAGQRRAGGASGGLLAPARSSRGAPRLLADAGAAGAATCRCSTRAAARRRTRT